MRLIDVSVRAHSGGTRVAGTIERGQSRFEVYFDYHDRDADLADARADAFAAGLLLPCMRAGEDLEIAPPVSPSLCFSLPRIRDIFCAWWPHLTRIRIFTAPEMIHGLRAANGAATFFSGGVDHSTACSSTGAVRERCRSC